MTDEAAGSRGPATTGAGPSQDAPAPSPAPPPADEPTAALSTEHPATAAAEEPTAALGLDGPAAPAAWTPPEPDRPVADDPPFAAAPPPPPPGAAPPPPPGADLPPPPPGAGPTPPPWFSDGGPTFVPEQLVRPRQGRYVAGVCAAIGRATNTDPVLWRVVLAVLGFVGGIGVLVYLIGWLAIPAEGDTASPVESLVGRGRSTTPPLMVVLLGGAALLTFAFVINDGLRAVLLGGGLLAATMLILRRNNVRRTGDATTSGNPAAAAPAAGPFTAEPSGAGAFTAGAPEAGGSTAGADGLTAGSSEAGAFSAAAPGASAAPGTGQPSADAFAGASAAPAAAAAGAPAAPPTAPLPPKPPQFTPPQGGYRPPFAPHGPWAGSAQQPPWADPAQQPPWADATRQQPWPGLPVKQPKQPKPPRERSKLGRITFFGVLLVLGVLAMSAAAGAHIPVPAYFAAALATIAAGLLVGAWYGRARGLIALGLLTTLGLSVSSAAVTYGDQVGTTEYRPQTAAAIADRYDFRIGDATLDLRGVDFAGAAPQATTVRMGLGHLQVLLPPSVDTTAVVSVDTGEAHVLGENLAGGRIVEVRVADDGTDGTGGGILNLTIEMDAGKVEVTR